MLNNKNIKKILSKKIIYLAVMIIAIGWIFFFDSHNFMFQIKTQEDIDSIKSKIEFYTIETKKNKKEYQKLSTDKEALEKFARENFLMKKNNEDIYIIKRDTTDESGNS